MEPELLQFIIVFVVGLVCGALLLVLWNKISSGSASASGVKQDYDDYKSEVEAHFEETSKKFQNMTEQYQDLYKHLSVGATSLCRPDSVAAALADNSAAKLTLEKQDSISKTVEDSKTVKNSDKAEGSNKAEGSDKAEETLSESKPAADKPASGAEKSAAESVKGDVKKEPELAKTADEKAKVEEVLGEKPVEALKDVEADAKKSAS